MHVSHRWLAALAPALAFLLVVAAPGPAGAQLLETGRSSARSWGEFETVLEVGWPRVGIGLRWGTWRGGHHMLGVDVHARSASVGPYFAVAQPVARSERSTLTGSVSVGPLIRPAHDGLPWELGLRVVPGISVCVGLGPRKRSCLEVGGELPVQSWFLRGLRPALGARALAGWAAHLGPRTSLAFRGRAGLLLPLGSPPAFAWSAGIVFRAQVGSGPDGRQSAEPPPEAPARSSQRRPRSSTLKDR